MGKLENGKWKTGALAPQDKSGAFVREDSTFRETISCDHELFTPEHGRYHLYVSYACPWACRTLIAREIKELQEIVSVSVVHPHMLSNGWTFETDFKGATGDNLYQHNFLYEIYQQADSEATTKVTVPVLWDRKLERIVNNESSEVLRIFNSSFNELTGNQIDLYPKDLQRQIDEVNERVYHTVNNGVYRAGFATKQHSYKEAVLALFETLDWLEERLDGNQYLVGEQLTEADIRLFVTLIRFDHVYYSHFKCNLRRLLDYPNLSRYTRTLYNREDFKRTVFFDHIKEHYYFSQRNVNPTGIVPLGPIDLGFN